MITKICARTFEKNLKLNALLQLAMGGLQKIDIVTHIKGSVETSLYKEQGQTIKNILTSVTYYDQIPLLIRSGNKSEPKYSRAFFKFTRS